MNRRRFFSLLFVAPATGAIALSKVSHELVNTPPAPLEMADSQIIRAYYPHERGQVREYLPAILDFEVRWKRRFPAITAEHMIRRIRRMGRRLTEEREIPEVRIELKSDISKVIGEINARQKKELA